jgi:hypothetical protein
VKALAPQHPEWKSEQPFEAMLDNDMKALAASGEKGILAIKRARRMREKIPADPPGIPDRYTPPR